MKIAIYTIALNEEKFASRFLESCKEADTVIVGDTGSTDNTRELLTAGGVQVVNVHQRPWRFDVPRNTVMNLVPRDIDLCIALDLDELLLPGWRDVITQNWQPDKHHRLRFRYVHSYNADGSYGTVGLKDFAHARDGYLWRHAVHEQLYWIGQGAETVCQLTDLVVEHRQDVTKRRDSYLPLLELAAREPGVTARHIFWLGREYTFYEKWEAAIETLRRYLDMGDDWVVERSMAMQLIAKCLCERGEGHKALAWHLKALELAPKQREPWMALAWYYHAQEDWPGAFYATSQAIKITQRPDHYLTRADCWNEKPYDLGALCAHKLGMTAKAQELMKIAIKMNPTNARLKHSAKVVGLHV